MTFIGFKDDQKERFQSHFIKIKETYKPFSDQSETIISKQFFSKF